MLYLFPTHLVLIDCFSGLHKWWTFDWIPKKRIDWNSDANLYSSSGSPQKCDWWNCAEVYDAKVFEFSSEEIAEINGFFFQLKYQLDFLPKEINILSILWSANRNTSNCVASGGLNQPIIIPNFNNSLHLRELDIVRNLQNISKMIYHDYW